MHPVSLYLPLVGDFKDTPLVLKLNYLSFGSSACAFVWVGVTRSWLQINAYSSTPVDVAASFLSA